jgi:hypothetical protein
MWHLSTLNVHHPVLMMKMLITKLVYSTFLFNSNSVDIIPHVRGLTAAAGLDIVSHIATSVLDNFVVSRTVINTRN